MRPLLTLSARYVTAAIGVVALLGVGAGAIRLLPWLVAPDVPFGLAAPFAALLAARALEVSVLVGAPMGAGIAAAILVERGEARALGALGMRPVRMLVPLVFPGILGILALGFIESTDSEPPGRLAARLLESGRTACAAHTPGHVDVPLVSLVWLCFENGPRLAGPLPGMPRGAWFTGRSVRLAETLGVAEIADLHLATALPEGVLRLNAARARVAGLPAWGPPRTVTGRRRGLIVGASAVAAALGCAWAILAAAWSRPVAAAAASGAVALLSLAALRGLDVRQAAAGLYCVVPALGGLLGALLFVPISKGRRSHVAGIKG